MPKYLMTGGAGFIGSNLVESLVKSGDKVIVYDDLSTGTKKNLQDYKASEVKLIQGDIRDDKELKKAMKGCDFVLHLAGRASIAESVEDPRTTLDTAYTGMLNVLQTALESKVKRIIYASSCAVYGESPVLPKDETMLPTPYSPYGGGVLLGEELARVFYSTYRLETVSLRLFNVYGPRERAESSSSGVVARFCDTVLRGETPIIYGDGKQSRDFVYVSDVVDAFRLACTAPKAEGEAFNIASGSRMSVTGLLTYIGTLLEQELDPEYKEARTADVRHSLAETMKAQEVLGYRPRVSLGEGLARTILWYRKHLGRGVKVPRKYN